MTEGFDIRDLDSALSVLFDLQQSLTHAAASAVLGLLSNLTNYAALQQNEASSSEQASAPGYRE